MKTAIKQWEIPLALVDLQLSTDQGKMVGKTKGGREGYNTVGRLQDGMNLEVMTHKQILSNFPVASLPCPTRPIAVQEA